MGEIRIIVTHSTLGSITVTRNPADDQLEKLYEGIKLKAENPTLTRPQAINEWVNFLWAYTKRMISEVERAAQPPPKEIDLGK